MGPAFLRALQGVAMIEVIIHLKETSQPIEHLHVINTYQKGSFFVVYCNNGKSYKYPIGDIFRVIEDYGYHGREEASDD